MVSGNSKVRSRSRAKLELPVPIVYWVLACSNMSTGCIDLALKNVFIGLRKTPREITSIACRCSSFT